MSRMGRSIVFWRACLQKSFPDCKEFRIMLRMQSKRDHLFIELHWLPIKFRIYYKLATLAFRSFDDSLPIPICLPFSVYRAYSSSHITVTVDWALKINYLSIPSVQQRETSQSPKNSNKTFISSQYQAPVFWKSLPLQLRDS